MKLEAGKWYRCNNGDKVHIDWIGDKWASYHDEKENISALRIENGSPLRGDQCCSPISEWSDPKLRPWKLEEVPLGAWMREKTHGLPSLIVAIRSTSVTRGHGDTVALDYALSHYEYSMDEGSTWKPCGVEE